MWEEDYKDRRHRVMIDGLDSEDYGAFCWLFGSAVGSRMFKEQTRKGIHLIYLYGENNMEGGDVGKPIMAGFIPEGVRVDTLGDVLSYVENPRWETHRVGEITYGFQQYYEKVDK